MQLKNMESLFSNYNLSHFTLSERRGTEYSDMIKWIGNNAFPQIKPKIRWIVTHKKLEKVPLIEINRWYHMAQKDSNPGLRFNTEFKRWRKYAQTQKPN